MGLSLKQLGTVELHVEKSEVRTSLNADATNVASDPEQRRYPKRVVNVRHAPNRRLVVTTSGVSILGPKISHGVYRRIYWAHKHRRIQLVQLLFHRHFMRQKASRYTYKRAKRFIRMDGKIRGWRLKNPPKESWGGRVDSQLFLLLQDIGKIRVKRSETLILESIVNLV